MKGHINPHHKVSKNLQVQHLRVRGALQTSKRWLRLTTHTEDFIGDYSSNIYLGLWKGRNLEVDYKAGPYLCVNRSGGKWQAMHLVTFTVWELCLWITKFPFLFLCLSPSVSFANFSSLPSHMPPSDLSASLLQLCISLWRGPWAAEVWLLTLHSFPSHTQVSVAMVSALVHCSTEVSVVSVERLPPYDPVELAAVLSSKYSLCLSRIGK